MNRRVHSISIAILLLCSTLLAGCGGTGDPKSPAPAVQSAIQAEPSVTAPLSPPPEYSTPEGNNCFMRYGKYVYYIPATDISDGSPLYRMHEDGSGAEPLLPGEGVTGFFIAGERLYATGQKRKDDNQRETILHEIRQDGSITEVKRYADGLLRTCENELYFTPLDPLQDMELAEEKERQWSNITGNGTGLTAKWIANNIFRIDGYLYYIYSVADVPGKKYHQMLVRALPDGKKEKTLAKGQLLYSDLLQCGNYLVFTNRIGYYRMQLWALELVSGNKTLLYDTDKVHNASGDMKVIGTQGGWVYFTGQSKNKRKMLFKVKPDIAKGVETVWDGNTCQGELWDVDLPGGYIYYGSFVRLAEEEQYMNSNDYHYILRSHRCRLDGSEDILFCDRSAQGPVTIGDWIYFSAADKEIKTITMQRYNTITKVLEEIPNGLVTDLTKLERL